MEKHDYQMALLLQKQFEQEEGNHNDTQIAVFLQEQFKQEIDVLKPTNGLTYDTKKRKLDDSKCLIDPSWELIDPTPDIHTLFVAFNQRFFWDKLYTVCVSWSKRMTSCAGVCSYSGRGNCNITLSEPLLKLRPRKDLVETLLHEMIHAYLFVTHSRDNSRDGHGVDFQKHMFRINAEAGTNITIYHDFHDEVKLYQQHWWRCDGPCRSRKPYFGMVRRATNRAPGPNDRWWSEHSRTCGGQFIKVKEPEKKKKGQNNKENIKTVTSPKNDIRNFFVVDNNKKSTTNTVTSSKPNIMGFKDVNLPKMTNIKTNSSSTIVVTKSINKNTVQNVIKPTVSSTTTSATTKSSPVTKIDYSVVRNHWLNKYASNDPTTVEPNKKQKVSNEDETDENVCCPVCSLKMQLKVLNEHLDACLENEPKIDEYVKCDSCNKNIIRSKIEEHFQVCSSDIFDKSVEFIDTFIKCSKCGREIDHDMVNEHNKTCGDYKKCLICGKKVLGVELNDHLEDCVLIFDANIECDSENVDKDEECDVKYNCPICMELIKESNMNTHLDVCLYVKNS